MRIWYFHIGLDLPAEPTKPATKMPLPNNVKWSPDGFCELNYRTIIAVLNGTRVNDKIAILEGIRWVCWTVFFHLIFKITERLVLCVWIAIDRLHRSGTRENPQRCGPTWFIRCAISKWCQNSIGNFALANERIVRASNTEICGQTVVRDGVDENGQGLHTEHFDYTIAGMEQ